MHHTNPGFLVYQPRYAGQMGKQPILTLQCRKWGTAGGASVSSPVQPIHGQPVEAVGEVETGCLIGNTLLNHLMYADDLAIMSPSTVGFQQLLDTCSEYGVEFDVQYNAKKSVVLICRTKEDQKLHFPMFYLSGQSLCVSNCTKYLGHIITDKMEDDADMYRQRQMLYVQANMLVRKFHYSSDDVKVSLFRAFCTPMYAAPLWGSYKKETLRKLQVAYNDCLRILLKKPRCSSASKLFVDSGLSTLQALLRNLMFKFMSRLDESQNCIIMMLTSPRCSSVRYQSYLWKHWYGCLLRLS